MRDQSLFPNDLGFLSVKIIFVLANTEDPHEMPRSVAFHLGLHCLQKYGFWVWGFQSQRVKHAVSLFFESTVKLCKTATQK